MGLRSQRPKDRPQILPLKRRPASDVALGLVVVGVRLGKNAGRLALRPMRRVGSGTVGRAEGALAAGGRAATERAKQEAGGAIDRTLAGPLAESIGRSLAEHRVVERVAREVLVSPDFQNAVRAALESPDLDRIAVDAAQSKLTADVVETVLQSPEVQAALARQTVGFADELVERGRLGLEAVDEATSKSDAREYAGLASRGVAFVIDLALAHVIVLLGGLLIWLVFSLVGGLRPEWLKDALAATAWFVVVSGYFLFFWTLAGQTVGMRPLQLRVARRDGKPIGFLRALVRFVGLLLSVVSIVGVLPVLFDKRRRALDDFLAGTVVLRGS
jgi:uncharacterized RDD family membrane protein YckC